MADALSRHLVNLVAVHPEINKTELAQAQATDPVLSSVIDHLSTSDTPPPTSEIWRTFPHKLNVLSNCGPNSVYMIPSCVENARTPLQTPSTLLLSHNHFANSSSPLLMMPLDIKAAAVPFQSFQILPTGLA